MNINISNLSPYFALIVGNSRLHWGYFKTDKLQITWDTPHLSKPITTNKLPKHLLLPQLPDDLPVYFASVVFSQTQLWETYPKIKIITQVHIPLQKLYPTLGIDRALAVLGAGKTYGFPCLVIDVGTALTFTGVDGDQALVGGAILPGLRLQFKSLANNTAALSEEVLPMSLPILWGTTTSEAIQSGIVHAILAGIKTFIKDWLEKFSDSQVIITGGDSQQVITYLKDNNYDFLDKLKQDSNLVFWGTREVFSLCIINNGTKIKA
ncbi:pantothenate kinase [cyanobacterium endosymbiont of Epithemia turgida]|uniref:pantothenate kinase n=1 Tax=cyanobacterium endosymbiont of Epithemia turgida TaxID=718217 RepID=UPI0004D1326F|nr:pantothenate kinase [cyanobacterium endosymbiont of Epithemia turgida]BAP18328.1 pantothenate kinase [cyanobacterium endosymbiont of Epithemia turgida isolate EtSB Lake Yunoko]